RHPRIRIVKIPHRDAHTPRTNLHAARHRIIIVLRLLLLTRRRVERPLRESDIQLRDDNIDPQIQKPLLGLNLRVLGWRRAHFEMRLQPHAIDPDASRLQLLDQVVRRRRLGTGRLDPVVIVVQLDVLAGLFDRLLRKPVREEEVLGPDGVVPDAGRPRPVRRQRLVDHVPRVAPPSPVRDQVRDVRLHHRCEARRCPAAVHHPVGQLADPDEVVAANALAVVFGDGQDGVAARVVEDIGRWFSVFELAGQERNQS
ncbi:hypothetical protein T310_8872, partial [Rasamsonia emersonii CBS 393.64]